MIGFLRKEIFGIRRCEGGDRVENLGVLVWRWEKFWKVKTVFKKKSLEGTELLKGSLSIIEVVYELAFGGKKFYGS